MEMKVSRGNLSKGAWMGLLALLVWVVALTSCGEEETPQNVHKVYVADEISGTVSVINVTTQKRVTTIDLTKKQGGEMLMFMPHNVQVAPDGQSVWVTAPLMEYGEEEMAQDHGSTEEVSEEVVVIDPRTDTITARIPVGSDLHIAHVVLDNDSRYAYVTSNEVSQVIRIDARTHTVVNRYNLNPGRKPHGLRFHDGKLFVANMDGKSLSIIEPESGAISEVPLGGVAVQTACTSDGRFVFVSLYDTREVIRYDRASGSIIRIPLPEGAQGPIQLYPSPDNRRLYVCDQGNLMGRPPSDKLFVLDVDAASVVATIKTGQGTHGVVVSEDGAWAYVTNTLDDTVSVVDTKAQRVVATVPVGDGPNGVSYWYVTGGMP